MEKSSNSESGTPAMVTTVRAVTLTLAVLCTAVCCMRLYMRAVVVKDFQLDDAMVVVALLMVNGFSALAVSITYYGLGRHQDTVSIPDLLVFLKVYYVALCVYLFVAAAVKTSLTIFIMRIFPTRSIQLIGRGLVAFIFVFSLSGELVLIFQCKPVRAFFDKTIINAKCLSSDTLFAILMYQGVLMFLMDIIILVLPMRAIWQLQMPVRKRALLAFMFSFGIIASAAALVRFSTLAFAKNDTDATFAAASSLIWMEVEFNLGLLAGSLSSLRKLFKLSSMFSSNSNSSRHKGSTGQYELSHSNIRHKWKGQGIMKTSEFITSVQEDRNDSQERIVPVSGQSYSTDATIGGKV